MRQTYIDGYCINFYKIKQIYKKEPVFELLWELGFFFAYFIKDSEYYLFFFRKGEVKYPELSFLFKEITVNEILTRRKRNIRSVRGFFLYASDIINQSTQDKILETNLYPLFWEDLRYILLQNRKSTLLDFLSTIVPLNESYRPEWTNWEGDPSLLDAQYNLDSRVSHSLHNESNYNNDNDINFRISKLEEQVALLTNLLDLVNLIENTAEKKIERLENKINKFKEKNSKLKEENLELKEKLVKKEIKYL